MCWREEHEHFVKHSAMIGYLEFRTKGQKSCYMTRLTANNRDDGTLRKITGVVLNCQESSGHNIHG